MEETLVGPHPVLHVHLDKDLVNIGQVLHVVPPVAIGVHKGQQEREVCRIAGRFLDNPILVQAGNSVDGFCH